MEIKIWNLRPVFLAMLFLASIPCLKAQPAGYFMEFRFVQRLVWSGDEYALRYEVVIEKEDDKGYRQTLRKFTDASFIEVSLEPGKYHYRVIPYDFRNQPGNSSDWKEFEIRAATSPELYAFSPSVFYVDDNTVHELNISTKNLAPNAEIYLRRFGGAFIVPGEKYINEDGSHARLFFNNEQLIPGDYEIVARNPGLKETSRDGFTIAAVIPTPEGLPTFYMSMGGMYFGYGQFHDQSFGRYGIQRIQLPSSFALRFDIALYKGDYFNFLLELAPSGYIFDARFNNDTVLNTLLFDVNFLFRWLFKQKAAFCFRPGLGIGGSLLSNNEDSNWWLCSAVGNISLSFQYLAWKHFFLESGVDVGILITKYQFGYILPWVFLGVKLQKNDHKK